MKQRPVGKTKDAGWQIGVSRTIPVDVDTAWDYLTFARGLATWLGAGVNVPLAVGQTYYTSDCTTGEIRSLRDRDRVRLTWQPADRPKPATVQIALKATATGCTFRFHTERLNNSNEREAMRSHWRSVADTVETELASDQP